MQAINSCRDPTAAFWFWVLVCISFPRVQTTRRIHRNGLVAWPSAIYGHRDRLTICLGETAYWDAVTRHYVSKLFGYCKSIIQIIWICVRFR